MSHRTQSPSRRTFVRTTLTLLGLASLGLPNISLAAIEANVVTVWKTPTCGCCKDWVIHVRKEGFSVVTNDVNDTAPIRQKLGLPAKFGSCHTAQVGGYVLEGHVPAREVKRLLRDKPIAVGLTVPGMPVGSPGMEMKGEMQGVRDAFDVLLVSRDGSSRVYESYAAKAANKPSIKS